MFHTGLGDSFGVQLLTLTLLLIYFNSVVFAAEKLNAGDSLHGYTVDSVSSLPEFDAKAVQLIHDRTKAKHLHIVRKDPNNTFRYIYINGSQLIFTRIGFL